MHVFIFFSWFESTGPEIGMSVGPVAQWIRHRSTEPGIAGSSPAGVIGYGMVPHKATPSRERTHDPALLLMKIAIRQTRDVCLVGLSGALCPKALR